MHTFVILIDPNVQDIVCEGGGIAALTTQPGQELGVSHVIMSLEN